MSTPIVTTIEAPKKLPKSLCRETLAKIGAYILEGLTEDEACIMAEFPLGDFKELRQNHQVLSTYLDKMNIEFKRKHLREVNAKKSDKNSIWMLENLRPEQFGGKKRPGGDSVNAIAAIIKAIRQGNDSLPVNIQDANYTIKPGGTGPVGQELTPAGVLK